ncbi:hypothetical protein ANN_07915, partial [Periplaneta americana]
IRGNFAPRPHAANLRLFCQVPPRCQIRLRNVLPESALDSNHVFLGLSRCGQFLLSYTYTTELDVMTFNQVYKYRLHWWAFVPHQQVRKVSEVMLFGNQGVYSTLFIAVCQWPMDYSRVLIYGNCQESYGQHAGTWSTSPPERSYLTITTVPSLNKCQDCLKVAASYEEEDLAASWDSCVRFSCLKHGLTVHTSFDVVSPFPKFQPTVCMKREGAVVFNTGNFLHVLHAELEHLTNGTATASKPGTENPDQNPSGDGVRQDLPLAHELDDGDQETRVYDTRSRTVLHRKQEVVGDSPSSRQDDCRFGANSCLHRNATLDSERHAHRGRVSRVVFEEEDYDDDIDDDIGASDDVISGNSQQIFFSSRNRMCSEPDAEHFLLTRHGAVAKSSSDDNLRLGSESRLVSASDSILRQVMKANSKSNESDNKRLDKESQEKMFKSEAKTGHCTKDFEALSIRERLVRDFRDGIFSGRITRSQTSRATGRFETVDFTSMDESCKTDTEKIRKNEFLQISHVSEKLRYATGDVAWKEGDLSGVCNRESRIMDSTQELNITCGNANPTTSQETGSSVTLMSPNPGTLLMVNTTEESESDDCQSNPDKRREIVTPSSSRSRRIRGGATVKLSSPLPALPANNTHNKIAEAEKAYEFTDDGLEPGCEKLSSFRRRRLADKKYEFCEEGEDAENIVPFRLTRRRELSPRLRSPPLYLSPSPLLLNHRRRHHETLSDPPELVISGPRSPQILASDIHPITQTANHLETDKVVLRPLNRNTAATLLLSPRDRDSNGDWVKNNNSRKLSVPDAITLPEHNSLEKPENTAAQPGNLTPSSGTRIAKKELASPSLSSNVNGSSNTTRCIVQLKRRYIEVDDELVSVITDIEDDDFSESTGYHCALPVEVHGAGYAQLQMISNTKAGKLFSRKMTERIEQRYCIKFCQKLDYSQSQTILKIQQVFGEDAMGVTQIKEWFNRFKDGRTSAESEQRCGRPQTARSAAVVERVRNLVMADRRLTVREIAEEVGVSKDSAHAILRDDLNMNRVAAKFVPKLLSPEQKDLRRDVAQDLLDTANTDPGFLNTVITGDESWVYGYDPETKRQSSQWKHSESPRPKKARQVRSKIKVMLTVFFDVRGIVHH